MELSKQMEAGHVNVFSFEDVKALHNLWLSLVAVIPQVGRRPRLIFDFTWSGLNKATKRLPPMWEIYFGGALHHILEQVLTAESCLGPVYLSKVYLDDAYMRLWLKIEEVPSVAFFIPKKNYSYQQLVGFQLSFPMGYVDSAPYLCIDTKTVVDLANKSIAGRDVASTHSLEWASEARAAEDAGAPEYQDDDS